MLEKPDIQDEQIITCLRDAYELRIVQVVFLPLGVDPNAGVYRAVADGDRSYFVKLRRGAYDETSVALPKFLSDQGVAQIIAPLATITGQLWASLGDFKVILYPFVEAHNGYEVAMSERHWHDFGTALKRVHTIVVPSALRQHIQRETYDAWARNMVKRFLSELDDNGFDDPVAVKLVAFLRTKHAEIVDLVERAERLAQVLQEQPPEFVVCHSDIHAGNILIDGSGRFYIVDWDNPILGGLERDLMFVGGGQGFVGHTLQEEETLFYQGYGQTQIDPAALAYYRYERIVQDIALFCEQILSTTEGGEDREQALRYLMSNFLPGSTIDVAYTSDRTRSHAKEELNG
jgi:spectinomycin phosphotransferase